MSWERLVLVLIAAVALAGFVVSPALGGPGFLTQKKANKLFLKKSAAKGLFLGKDEAGKFATKADTAGLLGRAEADGRFYTRAEADARFLRPEGAIRVTTGPSSWAVGQALFGGTPPTASLFADALKLTSKDEVTATAMMTPDLPAALYGRATRLAGVELCYDAETNAKLGAVFLELFSETTGISGEADTREVAKDGTTRTDNACRTYSAPAPVSIGPGDYPILTVVIEYPTKTTSSILLGRVTFSLVP